MQSRSHQALLLILLLPLALPSGASHAAELCLTTSPSGINGSVNCDLNPTLYNNEWVGFTTDATPCQSPFAIDPCLIDPGPRSGEYVWTISSSSTDPLVSTGSLPSGAASLYLWYLCDAFGQGLSAAEFSLTGTLPVLGFAPLNGFLNAGSNTDLLIVVGGCPSGNILAGHILVEGPISVEGASWGEIKALYR